MNNTKRRSGILVIALAQWFAMDRDSARLIADESQPPLHKCRSPLPRAVGHNKK